MNASQAHYWAQTFPVFPVHYPVRHGDAWRCSCNRSCSSPAKHPLTPRGLHDASQNSDTIDGWWDRWPDANLGLFTGNGLFALDVDPRHDGDLTLRDWQAKHGRLPRTWTLKTGGGGLHFIFRTGRPVANGANVLGPGVDIRGDCGYIIGPGSRHITGRLYAVDTETPPDGTPIATAPDALMRNVATRRCRTPEEWVAYVSREVGEGERNNTIASITGMLLRQHVDPDVTRELMQGWNALHCVPRLDAGEVSKIVNSIIDSEAARRLQSGDFDFNPAASHREASHG